MKSKIISVLSVAVFLLYPVFALIACTARFSLDFTCFNTGIYIAANGKISAETENAIKSAFINLDKTFSVKDSGVIAEFNAALSQTPVTLTADAENVVNSSKELYFFTDGLFNPAVLPLLKLWRLSADTFNPSLIKITAPDESSINEKLPLCSFDNVSVENGAISKSVDGVMVDFGGIVKGYAAEKAKDILLKSGVTEGYVSVGGSSIYVFSVEEDLSVVHPRKRGEYIFTVDKELIKNSPLSTSGDYIRYYTDIESGKRYPHIINGFTGYPADTGIISATVIAGDSAPENLRFSYSTDAISTALMLMEKEKAVNFIKEKLNGFYVFIVFEKDGIKEIISNTDKLSVIDNSYTLTVI